MTDEKKESVLSSNFNLKLKKSIKRNLVYKNILAIILSGVMKSAMIIIVTVMHVFTPPKK